MEWRVLAGATTTTPATPANRPLERIHMVSSGVLRVGGNLYPHALCCGDAAGFKSQHARCTAQSIRVARRRVGPGMLFTHKAPAGTGTDIRILHANVHQLCHTRRPSRLSLPLPLPLLLPASASACPGNMMMGAFGLPPFFRSVGWVDALISWAGRCVHASHNRRACACACACAGARAGARVGACGRVPACEGGLPLLARPLHNPDRIPLPLPIPIPLPSPFFLFLFPSFFIFRVHCCSDAVFLDYNRCCTRSPSTVLWARLPSIFIPSSQQSRTPPIGSTPPHRANPQPQDQPPSHMITLNAHMQCTDVLYTKPSDIPQSSPPRLDSRSLPIAGEGYVYM